MKYKVGDKVKIKTWKRLVKEFGFYGKRCINTAQGFMEKMEEELNKLNCNRNLIIKDVISDGNSSNYNFSSYYKMEKTEWNWDDDVIECLAEDYVLSTPIENRFKLLDL